MHGGVETLLERVPTEGWGALTNVATDSLNHRRAAYDAGGLFMLLAAMRTSPLDSQVHMLGCQALNHGVLVGQHVAKADVMNQECLAVMETAMTMTVCPSSDRGLSPPLSCLARTSHARCGRGDG
jgi:hypothetical protein